MTYKVLYREWRPQTFAQITGQDYIIQTLQNAVLSQKVAHAYVFCGPRGTGKTSTAKVLAKALNCLQRQGAEPCGQCSNCQEINLGSSMDVIEIDAASNRGIDEVREIRESVKFLPASGCKRVYIIDEVHMLTDPAFNALLKTLEEPPEHLVFILATTEAHKLPLTILSRCQRFDFRRISEEVMTAQLQRVMQAEGMEAEENALKTIIQAADGGLRDALGLLDQVSVLGQGQVTTALVNQVLGIASQEILERFLQALSEGSSSQCLELVDLVYGQGQDLQRLVLTLTGFLRQKMIDWWEDPKIDKKNQWLEALHILSGAEPEMRWSSQPRIILELALVQACRLFTQEVRENTSELELKMGDLEREIQALRTENINNNSGNSETKPVVTVAGDFPEEPNWEDSFEENMEDMLDFEQLSPVKPVKSIEQTRKKKEEKTEERSAPLLEREQVPRKTPAPAAPKGLPEEPAQKAEDQQRLKKIISVWPKVLNYIQETSEYSNLGAYLSNGQESWPDRLLDNNLVIALWQGNQDSAMRFALLNSEDNKKILAQIMEEICGWKPEISFQVVEQKPPLRKASKPSIKSEVEKLFAGSSEENTSDSEPF